MVSSDIQIVRYYFYGMNLVALQSPPKAMKPLRQYRRQAGAHADMPISLQLPQRLYAE